LLTLKLKNQVPLEHDEQVMFVKRMDLIAKKEKFRYFAVVNGSIHRDAKGKTNFGQIAKLKAEGQADGMTDLVILKAGKALFIEMKRIRGSSTSPEQKEWIEWLSVNGFTARVAKGNDEAYSILIKWLSDEFNPF